MIESVLNNPEILLVLISAAGCDAVRGMFGWRDRARYLALARQGRDLPQLRRIGQLAVPRDVDDIRSDVATLRLRGDWDGLADLLRWAAAGNRNASDGRRRYAHVIDAALADVTQLADRIGTGLATPAEKAELNALLNGFAEEADYSQRVEVAGLAALAHQRAANGYAGQDHGRSPSRTDKRSFYVLMARAEGLVSRAGLEVERSIYLALAWSAGALGLPKPEFELERRFEDLLSVDDRNPEIWIAHARALLPGWYGSNRALASHAARAARECEDEGVYARVLEGVADVCDFRDLPGFTDERLIAAIDADLSRRKIGQDRVNLWLRFLVDRYGADVAAPMMRRYMTMIVSPFWADETDLMATYALAFSDITLNNELSLVTARMEFT